MTPLKIRDPQVGARLRKARESKGLSQRELADKAELSHAFVSRIESGDRNASVSALRAFASALEVSPHYLETGDEHGVWVYVTRAELTEGARDGCTVCATHLAESPFATTEEE